MKFIETVFFHYDCDLNGKIERAESLGVSETDFIASLRKIHPELSDDTIRLIFKNILTNGAIALKRDSGQKRVLRFHILDTRNIGYQ